MSFKCFVLSVELGATNRGEAGSCSGFRLSATDRSAFITQPLSFVLLPSSLCLSIE